MHFTHLAHGLRSSLRNNGQAYGFSVSITAALALLNAEAALSGVVHIICFALGAALAFSMLQAVASSGFRKPLEREPSTVTAMGISLSPLSVGATTLTAWAVAHFIGGLAAWPLAAFLVSVVYPLIAGFELSVAQRAMESSEHGRETENEAEEEEEGREKGEEK
ncbi:hypothetical protein [Streptomyces aidingensis]|uniref:Uncharacterized protein n=1 Tax=Streptomyces aidingensis TaxID=910347 RepID=A0A1I1EQH0_9ACTN|nr:hypothetical protein [Streptomyces aidingensis]SFB87748.1 hypothetical protein SAMN05421773_101353 [Streptomyces aidingensis]